MTPAETVRIHPAARNRVAGLWAIAAPFARSGTHENRPESEARSLLDPSWTLDNLKDDPTAAAYRKVSWAVGIDPTKNRPAGEALARRILNQGHVPPIHPFVDAYNLASAATLVPLGAYDLDHTALPLTIRMAEDGDTFHGIGRQPEPVDPARIVYADAHGHVCGVFLWRDAQHSRIRKETQRALIVAIGADPVAPEAGRTALARAAEHLARVGFMSAGPAQAAPA